MSTALASATPKLRKLVLSEDLGGGRELGPVDAPEPGIQRRKAGAGLARFVVVGDGCRGADVHRGQRGAEEGPRQRALGRRLTHDQGRQHRTEQQEEALARHLFTSDGRAGGKFTA